MTASKVAIAPDQDIQARLETKEGFLLLNRALQNPYSGEISSKPHTGECSIINRILFSTSALGYLAV
jgi:hypothetical protein